MSEPTILIWTLVALVVVLMLGGVFAVYSLVKVRIELGRLHKTLERLEARVGDQERRLAELRASMEDRGGDLFAPFVEVLKRFKSGGWVSALTVLGSHVFRSYLGKRRQKSLPARDDS
jgi:hypothetical protein